MEDKTVKKRPHKIVVEERRLVSICGVGEVESFDEQEVRLLTELGLLNIKGAGLHINKFSVDDGELSVEGDIDALFYTHEGGRRSGFMSRLFK